jgi:hypothetical protein
MKTGISIGVAVIGTALGIYYWQDKKKKDQIRFDEMTNNYFAKASKRISHNPENSFIEFFNKDSIKEAYDRYEKYLDLGLKKDDAFKAVVEDDRNT